MRATVVAATPAGDEAREESIGSRPGTGSEREGLAAA